ncbi:beta-lactamase family protein [Aureitalea sp. L0-47]|uniref:serine hydrolase domain-containing protein n=1 Tax=Aureitalea sp. L0-47 TaxID=2816962 RepID=UPI0022382BEB|nr:serine hydrolase domain-containing protein [Aureitalea sp. L0-47]MCW5518777.1 beta-lactamase family protein [Aureitalea sp. L0-47]
MKNKTLILKLLIITLLFCSCGNVDNKTNELKEYSQITTNLDEYFKTLSGLNKFNGAVLISKDDHRILFNTYNIPKGPSTLRITKNSQFDIHSISKLMAKAVVIDLEKEGRISQSDRVSKFIPDFPAGNNITIKHLIENQSGLPREFNDEVPNLIEKSAEEMVDLIMAQPLIFEPGDETVYSNLGYQLLYYIISQITGKPFVQTLDEKYFLPLNMKNSGAHFYLEKGNLNQAVTNHENNDGEIVAVPNINSKDKRQSKIYSTVEDLELFINHIKSDSYKDRIKNSKNTIGWSGGGDGILSHAEYNIEGDYNLIFFSNYDEIPFGQILNTVDKIIKGKPYELPKVIKRNAIILSEQILRRYEGDYRLKEFNDNIFGFKLKDGYLMFYQNGEENTVLNAESETTFFDEPDAEDYFEFREIKQDTYQLIFHFKGVELKGEKLNGM